MPNTEPSALRGYLPTGKPLHGIVAFLHTRQLRLGLRTHLGSRRMKGWTLGCLGCWGPFPAYFITAGVQKGALGEHQSIPESSANSELASFKMTCFVRWMYCLLECNSITIVNFFPAIFPIVYRARTPKLVAHHSNCLVLKILLLPLFSTPEFSMFMCM